MAWRSGVMAGAVSLAAVLGSENSLAAGNCTGRNEIMTLKLAEIQQQLMTSASACRNADEYRHFVEAYKPALDLADRAMQNVFRATSGGDAAYNAFKDELAKGARLRSLTDNAGFCAEAHEEFRAAVSGREAMESLIDAEHPYVDLPILDCNDPRAAAMMAARNVSTNELGFARRGVLTEEVAALPLNRVLGVHVPGVNVRPVQTATDNHPVRVAAAMSPPLVSHGNILPQPAMPHLSVPQWSSPHISAPQLPATHIATAQPAIPSAANQRMQAVASVHPAFAHEAVKLAQVAGVPLNRMVSAHVPAMQISPSFPHETVKFAQVTAVPSNRAATARVPALQISPSFPHRTVKLAQVATVAPARIVMPHVPQVHAAPIFPHETVRFAQVAESPVAQNLTVHVPHLHAAPGFAHETVRLAQAMPASLAQGLTAHVPHIHAALHFAHESVKLAQVIPDPPAQNMTAEVPQIAPAARAFAHRTVRQARVKPATLARTLVAEVPEMTIRAERVAANASRHGHSDAEQATAQLGNKPVAQIPDMTARLAEAAARAAVLLHDEAGARLSARATIHRAIAAIDDAAGIHVQKPAAHAPSTRVALADTLPQPDAGAERSDSGANADQTAPPSDSTPAPADEGTDNASPSSPAAAQFAQAAERAAVILRADADARARAALHAQSAKQATQHRAVAHHTPRPAVSNASDPARENPEPPQSHAPVQLARADLDRPLRSNPAAATARTLARSAPAVAQTASAHPGAAVIRPVAVVGAPLTPANASSARLERDAANVSPSDESRDGPKATTYDDSVMPDKADGNGGRNPHTGDASGSSAPATDQQRQRNADQGADGDVVDPNWNGDSEQAYAYEYGPARAAAEASRRHRRAAWRNYDSGGSSYGDSEGSAYSPYSSWRNDPRSASDWPDQ